MTHAPLIFTACALLLIASAAIRALTPCIGAC